MVSELVKEIYGLRGMTPGPATDACIAHIASRVSALEEALESQLAEAPLFGHLIRRLRDLEERVEQLEEDLYEDEDDGPPAIVDEIAGVPFEVPEVTTCGCPDSDDDVHEFDCVNHPEHHQHVPVEDEWRSNPYSLPPATREGVECPACSGTRYAWGPKVNLRRTTRHEDQATVDECVKRQKAMGWKPLEGESGCGHP